MDECVCACVCVCVCVCVCITEGTSYYRLYLNKELPCVGLYLSSWLNGYEQWAQNPKLLDSLHISRMEWINSLFSTPNPTLRAKVLFSFSSKSNQCGIVNTSGTAMLLGKLMSAKSLQTEENKTITGTAPPGPRFICLPRGNNWEIMES